MRDLATIVLAVAAVVAVCMPAGAATYYVHHDFNSEWTGDYAPGWENTLYRHGPAPSGKMMDFYAGGRNGSAGMRLIADNTPESWMWWAAVNPTTVNETAMEIQHDPWMSAWYYDEGYATEDAFDANLHRVGQINAVPSWTNPYLTGDEDWTDVQFGARSNQASPNDQYYYVAAGESSPGWVNSGVDRTVGWHQLKMQLLSADGMIHFYVDGNEVGTSYRDDYADLVGIGLMIQFTAPLGDWTHNKPWTIWDDYEYGSNYIPEPASLLVMMAAGLPVLLKRRRRRS